MSVRCTVLVYGQPRQHLPRPQSVRICQLFHHHLLRPCLKSNPKKKVKNEVQVKKEMQCYRCDYPIKKNACGGQRPVTCDICHAVYHMSCAKLRFPPKHGSWAYESCVTEMIGSQ